MNKIRGSGGGGKGGGGSGQAPQEQKDNLQSVAYAKVLDLVSEGEIEGLVKGFESVYLDGTPLKNSDGTFNFSNVQIVTRTGLPNQGYIPGFSAAEAEQGVGVEVKYKLNPNDPPFTGAVTRTITNSAVDAVRVRISMPQMTFQNPSTGDLTGTSVTYAIELSSNGGPFQEVLRDTVTGKSTSKYERDYRVDLTGDSPWQVRVKRYTEDSTTVTTQNRTIWESYTEIVDGKLRYPNSALVALKIDSKQFNSIPVRGYDMKGLKIRVPYNYDPTSRTYSGSWDGTFKIAWTDNPAWILYDILTSERYGLGGFIPESHVDKWSLYTIARYCDELVPDGNGGTEPRFTCNMYLQTRQEAYQLLQDLASCFRGMIYWSSGTITAVQDAPMDPAHLFTPANVVDGRFTYSGSSAKNRHTVAVVAWNDPEDLYRQKVEYVEDQEGIARYGVIETQIAAFGCTSRGQANRAGRWLLYSEQYQTETVTFATGLTGAICRPGQIIKVADPARAGSRRGGRIASATSTSITVDTDITLDPNGLSLSVILPSGEVEERTVLSAGGRVITVTSAFSSIPQTGAIWMVTSATVEAQLFKIIGVSEGQNGTYSVTAIAHDPQKYGVVEEGLELEPRDISDLSQTPNSPSNVTLTETLYEVSADVRVKVTISWDLVPLAGSYVVQYQRDESNLITLPETRTNDVEILNAEPGTYRVTVYAISPLGKRSVGSIAQKKILGKALPPGNVQNFSLIPLGDTAYLSWTKAVDLDVLLGGVVRIRHTPDLVGAEWRNAVDITPALPGNTTRFQTPLLSGTYMAKFIDSSGVPSSQESIIVTSVPAPLAQNVVYQVDEHPSFSGTRNSMEFFPTLGGLAISGTLVDDILVPVDEVLAWDFGGGVASSGSYLFANTVDLLAPFSSRVTARIKAEAVDVADTIDFRTNLCDEWLDLDGAFIDDVNAELYMRTTTDDPSSMGAVWTPWKPFFVGDYLARGYQFELRCSSLTDNHNMVITELSVSIDMPDRVVNLSGLVSGAGTLAVSYPEPFFEVPSVGITGFNLNSGDYYQISNNTKNGFDIVFRNSGGTAVSRTFDVLAKGYGRQV